VKNESLKRVIIVVFLAIIKASKKYVASKDFVGDKHYCLFVNNRFLQLA
jgi:hypothetical protein